MSRDRGPVRVVLVAVSMVVAGVVGVVVAPSAGACSCGAADDTEAFDASDAVFSATSMERLDGRDGTDRGSADPVRYVFDVDRVYKGDVHATQSVVTAASGAACGLELTGPGPFLVFAYDPSTYPDDPAGRNAVDGELVSGQCSGSRRIADGGPVPVSFGAGATPISGSSPVGGSTGAWWWPWAPAGAAGVLVVVGVGMAVRRRARRRGDAPTPS